jgi:spermidine/putrescine transport system substrate-binding protein
MLNWSQYDDPDNMKAFQTEFGVPKFQYDIFSSDDELQAKLAAGLTGYDIAAPTALFLPVMVQNRYIQKLDLSRVPNFKYIDPAVLSQPWDPTNEYHIPKDFGTTGILYRSKVVKEPVTSWREFYDLATGKYSGKVVLADSALDVYAMPLKMLGYSLNSVDPAQLEEARKLLMDLAPHILALDSDTYQDKLATEEAVLALGWTGPLAAMRADPKTADIRYVIPSEGTLFWMDAWVLFTDAPDPNAAYAWFDFVERPAVQAKESLFTGYGTPNLEAKKLLPADFVNDPAVFPPAAVMSKLEGASPDAASNELRLKIYSDFKAAIGA